ncbi:MAG: hypothetical protein FJ399_01080 [Verrucomicrobia bacterium]|nr:hypothetical protein [Verrucomicrobiota bacterium]
MKIQTSTALALILAAALWRVAAAFEPSLANISPITALAFCGALYFRDWRMWLVPLLALTLSDLWLNHYHATAFGYTWTFTEMLLRAGCLGVALGFGRLVARRRHAANLLSGALASSLAFYLVTNTAAWAADAYYPGNAAGWWMALTVGHPEFPPTLWFFRNTLAGDLLFTGLFVGAMAFAAARARKAEPQAF